MGNRVTKKMLQEWVSTSTFGQIHGCHVIAHSGFYWVKDGNEETWCSGETPLKCWEKFNLIKMGWYMHEREN